MLLTKGDIVARSMNVPGGAFHPQEAGALYELLMGLPEPATTVEIGVYYGRSSSVFLQVAMMKELHMTFIDNWSFDPPGIENLHEGVIPREQRADYIYFLSMVHEFEPKLKGMGKVVIFAKDSKEVGQIFHPPILDLVFIDGDHEEAGVWMDCRLWMPKLKSGGIACFHDYGHSHFPGVANAIAFWCRGWEEITQQQTLAIRRKP